MMLTEVEGKNNARKFKGGKTILPLGSKRSDALFPEVGQFGCALFDEVAVLLFNGSVLQKDGTKNDGLDDMERGVISLAEFTCVFEMRHPLGGIVKKQAAVEFDHFPWMSARGLSEFRKLFHSTNLLSSGITRSKGYLIRNKRMSIPKDDSSCSYVK